MKAITYAPSVIIADQKLKLPISQKRKSGYYLPILERTVTQLDAMLSHHSKVLVFRLDLHMQYKTDTNKVMSELLRLYRKWVKRHDKDLQRVGFIWCREQNISEAQHYHLAIMLNANRCRHPYRHIEQLEYYWEALVGGGSAYTPENCYQIIKRRDLLAYQKVFSRLSYLAKVETKGSRPKNTNDYSTSRIKPKVLCDAS